MANPNQDLFSNGTAQSDSSPTGHGPCGSEQRTMPLPVFSVRLVKKRDHVTTKVSSPEDASRVACELLDGFDREAFLVLALSSSARLIGAHIAHVGSLEASIASPREIFRFAILCNARAIIVAHNHPSGDLEPSREDVAISRQLRQAGHALSIELLDSLVVGFDGRFRSLEKEGFL